MKTASSQQAYRPYPSFSTAQTLLWFIGGVLLMFVLVSAAFAIKLGVEGRLPFVRRTVDAPRADAATPPPTPAARPTGQNFSSGAETILPPEVSHLAKTTAAPDTVPARPTEGPAPSAGTPGAATPASAPVTPAPVTPAAATPAAAPAPVAAQAPATRPVDPTGDVTEALHAWVTAWARRDVPTYLEHYAQDFRPAAGLSRSAWQSQRRQRLSRGGELLISLSDVQVQVSGDKATARFVQSYRSDTLTSTEPKTLELIRRDGHWLILSEQTGS